VRLLKTSLFNINGKGFWVNELDQKDLESIGGFIVFFLFIGFIFTIIQSFYMPVEKDFITDTYLKKAEEVVMNKVLENEQKYWEENGYIFGSSSSYKEDSKYADFYLSYSEYSDYEESVIYLGEGRYQVIGYISVRLTVNGVSDFDKDISRYLVANVKVDPKRTVLGYVKNNWDIENINLISKDDYYKIREQYDEYYESKKKIEEEEARQILNEDIRKAQ
jgi:hypothetical protein